jgi:hypothetical protein
LLSDHSSPLGGERQTRAWFAPPGNLSPEAPVAALKRGSRPLSSLTVALTDAHTTSRAAQGALSTGASANAEARNGMTAFHPLRPCDWHSAMAAMGANPAVRAR